MTVWTRAGATTVLATLLVAACSSVPDIQYADGGGSSSGGSSGGSSGQPDPPPDWDCSASPPRPPPDGTGICCGSKICIRCEQSDCTKCEESGCSGTVSATCCKNKGNGNIMCRSHDGC